MMRITHACVLSVLCSIPLFCQVPVVGNNGVVNGASFDNTAPAELAPGGLLSIFGTQLADSIQFGDTVPLSNTIENVTVSFNGIPAGLTYVSPGQINAQLPWNVLSAGATSGIATLTVTRDGVMSAPAVVNVAAVGPGVFSIPPAAGNAVAVINGDPNGAVAAPAGSIPGLATHPAAVGDILIVYATGLGAVDSPIDNGAAPGINTRHTLATPTVLIGGQTAQVLFSGLSPQFPGVNQLNVVIPAGVTPGDAVPFQLQMGNVTTTNKVTIAIH